MSVPRIQTFRIVESDPEASLNPRDIWDYWKRKVIWDPRTYYGLLECIGILVLFLSIQEGSTGAHRGTSILDQKMVTGLSLLVIVPPLHWFSNHRTSSNILTRTQTHVAVLLLLSLIIFLLQITAALSPNYLSCQGGNACQMMYTMEALLWSAVFVSAFAAYLVYTLARNPRKDPLLAELPSPVDEQGADSSTTPWTHANVAEGIEDDSLEPEGQVRL